MNQSLPPNGGTDAFGRTTNPPVRASGAPMIPGTEKPASTTPEPRPGMQAGQDNRANEDNYNRPLSPERAGTLTQRASEHIGADKMTLPAMADSLREGRDEWMDSVRTTIRSNPLGSVAAALALGAVITRITR